MSHRAGASAAAGGDNDDSNSNNTASKRARADADADPNPDDPNDVTFPDSTARASLDAWCACNGLLMVRAPPPDASNLTLLAPAPVTLLPFPFSRAGFATAKSLAPLFNRLVDAAARDADFLAGALRETAAGDAFTGRLLSVYERFGAPGKTLRQPLMLGVHRSDYMMDAATNRPLQVELNTISSSFACLSARVTRLHRHLLRGPLRGVSEAACGGVRVRVPALGPSAGEIPDNAADSAVPAAIARAHEEYARRVAGAAAVVVVVAFIVQPNERNAVDQRHVEHALLGEHGVRAVRLTLRDVAERGRVVEGGRLRVDGAEVSVAYFRAGYTPDDYPTAREWDARELIESSLAVKCPSIGYHLVGAKKVQQKLAERGVVERFLGRGDAAERVRACFAGLWSLGADLHEDAVRRARLAPDAFVVKPQREGGGNNLYGERVRVALGPVREGGMSGDELAAHILMERIFPPRELAVLARAGEPARAGACVAELGVYGVFLGDGAGGEPLVDADAGHLLRVKSDGVDEGGVAAGFAFLSSPWLV